MKINFSDYFAKSSKSYYAKSGPNKIFGNDIDERKDMNSQELLARFDQVWSDTLKDKIEKAKASTKEQKDNILKKLKEIYKTSKYPQDKYFRYEDEHREFRIYGIDCVAQLSRQNGNIDEYELNNLWFFYGGDEHPDWLIIKFDTVKERELFTEIADKLNQSDEKLGKELIYDFMKKFDNYTR